MRPDHLRSAALIAASVAIGWIGWSGNVLSLPIAALFPAVWSLSRTRAHAAAVSAGYFLAASRGLPQGVANFYASDLWPGLLLWLIASAGFVIVHSACWTHRAGWQKPLRYLIASVIMAVPPFGITGWAHPVTAAGVLFPSWGWLGLVTTVAGLAIMTTRLRPVSAMAMIGCWLWSATHWTTPISPVSYQGVDLQLGSSLGRDSGRARQQDLIAAVGRHASDAVVVLPEGAIGFWTPTVEQFWRQHLATSDQVVIAGASVIDKSGYDNVLVRINGSGGRILYRERMPVPVSMWQPWLTLLGQPAGARAYFFANPVVTSGAIRLAPLICYEQLLVWPVLQSMLFNPDAIVAVGNGWWTTGTSIIDIQKASTEAWAMLFDKPVIFSFNI